MRFKQIFYRVYYRFRKVKVSELDAYAQSDLRCKSPGWRGDAYCRQSIFENESAQFLNKKVDITSSLIWNDSSQAKLWLYNLHYMDDLSSIGSDVRFRQQLAAVRRWILENPAAIGNGWEPYPLSLRLVNLIKWVWSNGVNDPDIDNSIAQQADALRQQPEYHIQANHLFANAKALVFCGSFLTNKLGNECFELGLVILEKEINEQFLEDGGHFELSPMYHSVMLWDIFDLIVLAENSNNSRLQKLIPLMKEVAVKGLSWLNSMCHPDGSISYFNDASSGIAPSFKSLNSYALKFNLRQNVDTVKDGLLVNDLRNTGFIVITQNGPLDKLIINLSDIFPNYQPGHAHSDSLSFELSLFGQKVFVNQGVSQYGLGEQRDYERSTEAHNTVSIDGENSSEIWAGFRVARRARIVKRIINNKGGSLEVESAHDGYSRFKTGRYHTRKWTVSKNRVTISDKMTNAHSCDIVSYYHLHPEILIEILSDSILQLKMPEGPLITLEFSGGSLSVEDYFYHPGFGLAVKAERIKYNWTHVESEVSIKWVAND